MSGRRREGHQLTGLQVLWVVSSAETNPRGIQAFVVNPGRGIPGHTDMGGRQASITLEESISKMRQIFDQARLEDRFVGARCERGRGPR